jgi:hypothetical protein
MVMKSPVIEGQNGQENQENSDKLFWKCQI